MKDGFVTYQFFHFISYQYFDGEACTLVQVNRLHQQSKQACTQRKSTSGQRRSTITRVLSGRRSSRRPVRRAVSGHRSINLQRVAAAGHIPCLAVHKNNGRAIGTRQGPSQARKSNDSGGARRRRELHGSHDTSRCVDHGAEHALAGREAGVNELQVAQARVDFPCLAAVTLQVEAGDVEG